MKKLICALAFVAVSLIPGARAAVAQETGQDDFENMTLRVELNKKAYLLLEPVFVKFSFSNETGTVRQAAVPSFLRESALKVGSEGEFTVFEHLSSMGGGPAVRFPSVFKPNEVVTEEGVLGPPFAGTFFPGPGSYQLRFVLRSSGGAKTIESNLIEITISEPEGEDKEAFDYLAKHKEFFGLSSWVPRGEEDRAVLETFVKEYGLSAYGELAAASLGSFYLARGDLDKAEAEFNKLKLSPNRIVAEEAKHSLEEIAKRKAGPY